jgi:MFS family permease
MSIKLLYRCSLRIKRKPARRVDLANTSDGPSPSHYHTPDLATSIGRISPLSAVFARLSQFREFLLQVRLFRRDIQLFLIYNLFSNVGIGAFLLIYNLYLVQNGFAESFLGVYNATTTTALALVAMVMGPLIGRFGGWRCITYGTMVFIVSSAALAMLGTAGPILLTSIIAGAGTAFLLTPIMPFILDWESDEHKGTAAVFAFSINSLSLTLGSFIGGWSPRLFHILFGFEIQSVMSYRLALLLALGVAAIGLIPMYRMQEARIHAGEEEGTYAAIPELPPTRQQVRNDIAVFAGATGLLALGIGAVMPFYNVYLNTLGARPSRIGMVFAFAGIVAAIAGLMIPSIIRKYGELNSLFWIRIAPAPVFLLLLVFPHLAIAALAHVMRTASTSMSWPLDSGIMGRVLPARARANGFSIRSGLWNLGYAASSLIAGVVIVTYGYAPTFAAFALFTVVSTVLFVVHFRRHPRIVN